VTGWQIKTKRDYLEGRHRTNWFYMSRIAALKEFTYMKALYDRDFKVPIPIEVNRHAVLMELVQGVPMCQVRELPSARKILSIVMDFLFRLVSVGLIHCDLNEFNIMVDHDGLGVTVIDFPQMISTSHENATEYFMRDVKGIQDHFAKKYGVEASWSPEDLPKFSVGEETALDVELKSSGFTREQADEFDLVTADIFSRAEEEEAAEDGSSVTGIVRGREDEEGSDSDSDSDTEEESEDEDVAAGGEKASGAGEGGEGSEDGPTSGVPEWVNADLEAQLIEEVGASLAHDDTGISEYTREAQNKAGIDIDAETLAELKAATKEARKKAEMKKKVTSSINRKERERKHGGGGNRNKLKGREKIRSRGLD